MKLNLNFATVRDVSAAASGLALISINPEEILLGPRAYTRGTMAAI
jgi:hypothetical protein